WGGELVGWEEGEVAAPVVREMAFELQGMNTSDCSLALDWTFLTEDIGLVHRSTPIEMRMPDRTVQFYETTIELGSTAGPLTAEWSGTTSRCPDDLDQSYFGNVEIWDEPSESASKRAVITSYTGQTLGFVYVIA